MSYINVLRNGNLYRWNTMTLNALSKKCFQELNLMDFKSHKLIAPTSKAISICRNTLSEMRKKVTTSSFKSQAEEIKFFKQYKQIPLSHFLFHKEIQRIEISAPSCNSKNREKYLIAQLDNCDAFCLSHIDFLHYTETNSTYLDAYYYTRTSKNSPPLDISPRFILDKEFSTPMDYTLAKIKSIKLLVPYIKEKLNNLTMQKNFETRPEFKINCEATKTDIVELTYALISSGAIRGDIRELATAFEFLFQMELGDLYRTFIEIRHRSIDRTKFLDELKIALLKRMDDADN